LPDWDEPLPPPTQHRERTLRWDEGPYAYDPITPPKLPHEFSKAIETARFVGDSEILFAFHEILRATAG
jgi:hypothetical protein